MLADFNFLAVSILVAGDLGVGLGLCLALLLYLDSAQGLSHRLQLRGALVVVAMIAIVVAREKVPRRWDAEKNICEKPSSFFVRSNIY